MNSLRILLLALLSAGAYAQTTPPTPPPPPPVGDFSGMYTFLQEGEFVQVSLEEGTRVTGFISRYADDDAKDGTFVEHFFTRGAVEADRLTFATKTIHGTWFEFSGSVTRGPGKEPGEEGYWQLRGTLTRHRIDVNKKTTSQQREVVLESFPEEGG